MLRRCMAGYALRNAEGRIMEQWEEDLLIDREIENLRIYSARAYYTSDRDVYLFNRMCYEMLENIGQIKNKS